MRFEGETQGRVIMHHQAIFNPNCSWRDDVEVEVIKPAAVTGTPLALNKILLPNVVMLFPTGGEKFG